MCRYGDCDECEAVQAQLRQAYTPTPLKDLIPPPEAKHYDGDKLGLQWILSMKGLDEVARVGDYGAKKYSQGNWRGGAEWMRFCGSMSRHLIDFIRGKDKDEESGYHPLAHLVYDALILLQWHLEGKGTDDRPKGV